MYDRALALQRFSLIAASHERPRQRWAMTLAAIVAGLFIAVMSTAFLGGIGGMVAIIGSCLLGPLAVGALAGTKKIEATEAEIEDGVLRLPGLALEVKKEEIRQGIDAGHSGVLLDLIDDEILRLGLPPADDGSAERLLEALGVGPDRQTIRVPMRRQVGPVMMWATSALLAIVPAVYIAAEVVDVTLGPGNETVIAMGMLVLAALMATAVVLRFGLPHIIVGSDGIRLRGTLFQPFLRYAQIKDVRLDGSYMYLELEDGRWKKLPLVDVDPARVSGLSQRIMATQRRGPPLARPLLEAALSRADRPLGDWKTALVGLAKREASFREAPLDRDEVARIATDPNAHAEQRVAATFVLSKMDPSVQPRIRVAVEATVDDELRSALLDAAEGELESAAVERIALRE